MSSRLTAAGRRSISSSRRPRRALSLVGAGVLALVSACGAEPGQPEAPLSASPQAAAQALTGADADACDFGGRWALKFEVPVSWRFNLGIEGGEGELVQWAISERRVVDGHTIEERITPCGSSVPTYRALPLYGGERYGVQLPDALFDGGTLPTLSGSTWVSGMAPGAVFRSEPVAIELGLGMQAPTTEAWPKRTSDLGALLRDDDADGHPGVTAMARTDEGLVLPPVNTRKTRRATHFYLALRNLTGARGSVTSCDRFEGSTIIPELGGRAALQAAILGCRIDDGSACSRGEATLANTFQPVYRVGEHSRSTMVRIDGATRCADVRAMNF